MSEETSNDLNPAIPSTEELGTEIKKFKTGKDRDEAYLNLEKQNSDQARRLAEVEAKIEAYNSAPAPQPERSFTDQYPTHKTDEQREAELASRLLTKPSEVLRLVREETMREVQALRANERVVEKFQREHPDLAKHEEIVAMFVRKQPDNLSADQRLKLAVPEARRYLASIASPTNQQATLDPAAYVESPTQRPSVSGTPAAEPTEDDELSALIRERSALQQKKMRV